MWDYTRQPCQGLSGFTIQGYWRHPQTTSFEMVAHILIIAQILRAAQILKFAHILAFAQILKVAHILAVAQILKVCQIFKVAHILAVAHILRVAQIKNRLLSAIADHSMNFKVHHTGQLSPKPHHIE